MKVADLRPEFIVFGNKGAVWNNLCHIAIAGFHSNTLCDVPMLSTNWAQLEAVKEIMCPKCLAAYQEAVTALEAAETELSKPIPTLFRA